MRMSRVSVETSILIVDREISIWLGGEGESGIAGVGEGTGCGPSFS
jgi:hypothetical protein